MAAQVESNRLLVPIGGTVFLSVLISSFIWPSAPADLLVGGASIGAILTVLGLSRFDFGISIGFGLGFAALIVGFYLSFGFSVPNHGNPALGYVSVYDQQGVLALAWGLMAWLGSLVILMVEWQESRGRPSAKPSPTTTSHMPAERIQGKSGALWWGGWFVLFIGEFEGLRFLFTSVLGYAWPRTPILSPAFFVMFFFVPLVMAVSIFLYGLLYPIPLFAFWARPDGILIGQGLRSQFIPSSRLRVVEGRLFVFGKRLPLAGAYSLTSGQLNRLRSVIPSVG